MRGVQPKWLIAALGVAGLALVAGWPAPAQAQVREARLCATQTEDMIAERIAACAKIIDTGRLKGKPLGVAYGLRGLAFLDRGDIAHAIADLNRAVNLAPDFAPAYQNRGNAWFARGNYGQAIADYDATIRLDPSSPSPYVNRATVRRDLGFTDGALEDYQKAISLGSERATPYSGRGQIYLRQQDYARAIVDFDRAVRINPNVSNYMLRAEAREGAGEFDRALSDYQEAARLDPKNIAALTSQAGIWRKKGDLNKSVAIYDRAVMVDQNVASTYRLRAEALAAKGERKRAMTDISRALKFAWDPTFLKVRGILRIDDGDLDGAVRDAEAMLKLQPDSASALALRGAAYARKKDYNRALADLDKAANGDDALAFAERGQIFVAKNDSDRAMADFSRSIELGSISAAPYRARAVIYKAKGETAKAMSDIGQAIQRDPRPSDQYFERAAMRKAKGETDLALADLNDGLSRQPDNLAGLLSRAQIKQSKGDTAGTIADYDAVLNRQLENLGVLRSRAALLMETKSFAKAADDFDRLIKLDPKNTQTYYQRGLAREKDDKRDLAIADYRLAYARDRTMADARQALERLVPEEFGPKPRTAERTPKAAAKTKKNDVAKRDNSADKKTAAAPVTAPVEAKKEAAADTPEQTATIGSKKNDKVSDNRNDRNRSDRDKAERKNKKNDRDARSQNERRNASRTVDTRQTRIRDDRPRYIRAGSEESRRPSNRYDDRRRNPRFTDIWTDRR